MNSKIKTLEEMILENLNKIEHEIDNTPIEEDNVRTCKVCNQNKKRISAGKYNFKDKRWVDETGKQWMGRTCPDCNVKRSKSTMRNTRVKNKSTIV